MSDFRHHHDEQYYRWEHEQLMEEYLKSIFGTFPISCMLTIKLHPPFADTASMPFHKYRETENVRFYKELINRLDRLVHGKNHKHIPDNDKFPYIYRLETKSRHNTVTMPHVHMLLGIDLYELDKIKANREKFYAVIEKLCMQMDYDCDIDLRNHDVANTGYISKFPLADILSFETRGIS